jgi:hypothetical protein
MGGGKNQLMRLNAITGASNVNAKVKNAEVNAEEQIYGWKVEEGQKESFARSLIFIRRIISE